jgi:hypothetical protein
VVPAIGLDAAAGSRDADVADGRLTFRSCRIEDVIGSVGGAIDAVAN